MRIVFLTIDGNHAAALRQAAARLKAEHGIELTPACYDAASLRDEAGWQRLERDMSKAALIFGRACSARIMCGPSSACWPRHAARS